ncbi:methylosome subunit pICln-like isoform X2 [Varroa jacobsoni]|uniref:Methylosome subunit pICln n=1 Tax=Varroa destructor TaxID=109461 RepID=A0A7M7MAQ3_VARDE|nr:methylosome subunit pICln-like [Varroa destructor]XP_022691936.1 methylosome subunit pICln-like isoform X2 [Varroa jacobsoni]
MVIATNFEPPTEGIRHQVTDTQALIRNSDFGKGTLYISEGRLCWSGESGTGFSLEYPAIQLHAISRDPSVAPRPCLYLLVEGNLLEASSNNEIFRRNYPQEQGAENGGAGGSGNGVVVSGEESIESIDEDLNDGSSSIDSTSQTTEVRFIPPTEESLPAMYAAMCHCSALHPDPTEQGDEDSAADDVSGEEYVAEGAEQDLGAVHHTQDRRANRAHEDEHMEGQFDDAD